MAALRLALISRSFVAAELAGPEQAQIIQLLVEYAPEPPFPSGCPETAPDEVIATFNATYGTALESIGGRLPVR